jgi:serine/threonine protein kinase
MSITQVDPKNLFKAILNICDDNTGEYVNQGTYGLGLSFKIADDKQSPISHITLDNRDTTGARLDGQIRTVFVKLVPLKRSKKTEETEEIEDWEFPMVNKKRINCVEYYSFITECKSQVEIYKRTNHNMDSFVPPLYLAGVLNKFNINLLKKKFSISDRYVTKDFFDGLKCTKDHGVGVIIMPCMPIPPIVSGFQYFNHMKFFTKSQIYRKYFNINQISESSPNNGLFIVKRDYDFKEGSNQTNYNLKKSLFYIVQILSGLLELLENGWIHGDLHLGNVLINPKQICTTQCFTDGTIDDNSPFMGKVFIIDYGTAVKVDNPRKLPPIEEFKMNIIKILETKGSHEYGPLDFFIYDWLSLIFYDDSQCINEQNISTMFSYVEQFREKRDEYQKIMIGNMMKSYPDVEITLNNIREMNASSNFESVFGIDRDETWIDIDSDETWKYVPSVKGGEIQRTSSIKLNPIYVKKKDIKDSKKMNSKVEKEISRYDAKTIKKFNEVAKEIFRYDAKTIKNFNEAAKTMMNNLSNGIKSVEALETSPFTKTSDTSSSRKKKTSTSGSNRNTRNNK